jgi:methyltransferase
VTLVLILVTIAFVPMLIEASRSAANERELRAAGALEPPGDVYATMQIAYPACFGAMILEAWLRGRDWPVPTAAAGLLIFAAAKALKYWAVFTLGTRWTFRVLVPPQSGMTMAGPYRFLRHPNYAGVLGELIGFALLASSPIAGLASFVCFGWLILVRIRVEERALGISDSRRPS